MTMGNLKADELYKNNCRQALLEYDNYMDALFGNRMVDGLGAIETMQYFAKKHEVHIEDMKNYWKDVEYIQKNTPINYNGIY